MEHVIIICVYDYYPTLPSISISMSLFSSHAYSSGNFFTIGEKKPFTIIAIAFSSSIPRDMR